MRIISDLRLALGYLPSSSHYEKQSRLMDDRHARFHSIAASEAFQRYLTLDAYINSSNYSTDIKRIKSLTYKDGPEHLQLQHYKELRKCKEIKHYFKKGVESDSPLLQEFIALHNLVQSDAFKQRVAYLKNKNKHKESQAYQQFLEYRRLKKTGLVKEYFSLQKKYKTIFHERDTWKLLFADEFAGRQLSQYWSTQQEIGLGTVHTSYVQNNEYHILDAKNVSVAENKLKIALAPAEQEGIAWDEKFGFISRDFNCSSGLVNTADLFQVRYGKIEAKLRVPKLKNAYYAFWLNTNSTTPAISLFNFCNNYLVTGIYQANGVDQSRRRLRLNHDEFYFLEVRWTKKVITWKINGKEIARKANTVNTPLFLHLAAGTVAKVSQQHLPQYFDIDWVKVHTRAV
jgi:hypothetical protein